MLLFCVESEFEPAGYRGLLVNFKANSKKGKNMTLKNFRHDSGHAKQSGDTFTPSALVLLRAVFFKEQGMEKFKTVTFSNEDGHMLEISRIADNGLRLTVTSTNSDRGPSFRAYADEIGEIFTAIHEVTAD